MAMSYGGGSSLIRPRLQTGNLAKPDVWRDRLPSNMGVAAGALEAHNQTLPANRPMPRPPQGGAMMGPETRPSQGAMSAPSGMVRGGAQRPNTTVMPPAVGGATRSSVSVRPQGMGTPMGSMSAPAGLVRGGGSFTAEAPAQSFRGDEGRAITSSYDMPESPMLGLQNYFPHLRQVSTTPNQVTVDPTGYTPGGGGMNVQTALEAPANPMIDAGPQEIDTQLFTATRTPQPTNRLEAEEQWRSTDQVGTSIRPLEAEGDLPTLQERGPIQMPQATTDAAPIAPGEAQSQALTAQEYSDASGGVVSPEVVQELLDQGYTIDEDGNVYQGRRADEGGLLGVGGRFANMLNEGQQNVGNIYEPEQGDEVTRRMTSFRNRQAEADRIAAEGEVDRGKQGALDELKRAQGFQIQGLDPALLKELLSTQQAQRAQGLARNRAETIRQALRAGLDPASANAMAAEISVGAETEGAGQDAQTKYQFALQDMQNRVREFDSQIALAGQIAGMLNGTADQEKAFAWQMQLMEAKAQQERDMAVFMQQFNPSFAEQALGGLLGVAGTTAGTFAGTYAGRKVG